MSIPESTDNIYAMSDDDLRAQTLDVSTPSNAGEETPTPEVIEQVAEETPTVVETPEQPTPEPEVLTPEEGTPEATTDDTPEPAVVEEETDTPAIDYTSFYETLTKPFKANGKEIQITDPKDIVTLMQKGADYSKKMAAIKPVVRIGKMLEENGLMDEEKLSFLIDIQNKKPEAIAKLIKESGIDLFEFDVTKGDNYVAPKRQIHDQAIELADIVEDLKQNSTTYARTISIVGKDWDDASREVLAQHPQILKIIDAQVQDGTFDQVSSRVEHERIVGRLAGMSDLDAYRYVGEMLFNQAQPQAVAQPKPVPPVKPAPRIETDSRKKAASSPHQVTAAPPPAFNPLQISDEELMKIAEQRNLY